MTSGALATVFRHAQQPHSPLQNAPARAAGVAHCCRLADTGTWPLGRISSAAAACTCWCAPSAVQQGAAWVFSVSSSFSHGMRLPNVTDRGLTAVSVPAAKHSQYSFRQPARRHTLVSRDPAAELGSHAAANRASGRAG